MASTTNALPMSGEVVLEQSFSFHAAMPVLPPLQFIWSNSKRLFTGIMAAVKDRKKLLPLLIMTFIWLIFTVLPVFGIKVPLLNFLTFARGGTISGVGDIIGASVGKGIISYFVFSFVMPLFRGGKPFAGIGAGMNHLKSAFSAKSFAAYGYLLLGAGASLIAYNFMAGDASLQNSMVGIVSFIVSLRTLSRRGGFFRGLLTSIAGRLARGKMVDASLINHVVAGWSLGFALAVPLSATGISYIAYAAGMLAAVVGVVMKKGAAA